MLGTFGIVAHPSQADFASSVQMGAYRLAQAGIEEPYREAQLLLAHILGVSRLEVIARPERFLTASEGNRFTELIALRAKRTPLAHLRGIQEFYGLEFEVTKDVLVPRPETEMLVDAALECLRGCERSIVVDIGTGSGCIAIAIAKSARQATLVATDRSKRALSVADHNARRHHVEDRIRFVQRNIMVGLSASSVDLIVSNPPYIPTAVISTLQPEVRDFEPRIALDGGQDGLNFYRAISRNSCPSLKTGGQLIIEVGMGQAGEVSMIFTDEGFTVTAIRKDLAGIERVIRAQKL